MLVGTIRQLSLIYGETVILNGVTADIPQGSRIAIVGANGAGKTTLLSLLAGESIPTSGVINWNGTAPSITYFRQEQKEEEPINWSQTERYMYRSKWNVPKEAKYQFASGGERMKMRLSAALAENSQLVLLDEPTNHLDSASLEELIGFIGKDERTFIIVSHDRYFIDQMADYVFDIENGKLTVYQGNYTEFQNKKAAEREAHQKHYEQQQRKIEQVEEQIEALGNWSEKAHAESRKKGGKQMGGKEYFRIKAKKKDVQIRSKRKRLEAELETDRIEKPVDEIEVSFTMQGRKKKGRRVLELKNVEKSFDTRPLFANVSFTIQAGERIACIGPNGVGKSTLFRMILGDELYEGDLWKTAGMTIGYLSQAVLDLPNDILMSEYFQAKTFQEQGRIRVNLINLGFSKEHWNLSLSDLSMGERVKLKLIQFILEETDVLILDEPTNHLDLPSREELERALATFPGTLLFASHDRYFTERMADGLLVFEDHAIRKIPMTYMECQDRGNALKNNEKEEEKLRLETELQAVLGKLSVLKKGDKEYDLLDKKYLELTKYLKALE